MLFDTSTASIISIPVRVTSFSLEPNCGRARPMTMKTSASAKIVNLVRTRFGGLRHQSPDGFRVAEAFQRPSPDAY